MQKKSTKTLYDYWNELRGARSAPDRRAIDPSRIREALANTFILQETGGEDFEFRLAGSHLCSTYCRELKGRSFLGLWHSRDHDAVDTLIRAVTEDHAVALITFQGTTETGGVARFETILLPLRHNGSTRARILGGMTALETPYWHGTQPVAEQRITGLRLIWPDEPDMTGANQDVPPAPQPDVDWIHSVAGSTPAPARVFGNPARRYAHLSVIDGGRSR